MHTLCTKTHLLLEKEFVVPMKKHYTSSHNSIPGNAKVPDSLECLPITFVLEATVRQ